MGGYATAIFDQLVSPLILQNPQNVVVFSYG